MSDSEYILKAKKIADHLTIVSDSVSDRDIIIFIIGGPRSNSNYMSFAMHVNMNNHKSSVSAL